MTDKKNKKLEIINEIPDISNYENIKLSKKKNWFNRNIAFLVTVLFVMLGIIIVLVIA